MMEARVKLETTPAFTKRQQKARTLRNDSL
jgi:hypothetical protein